MRQMPYTPSQVDFLVVTIVGKGIWYVIPVRALEGRLTIHLYPFAAVIEKCDAPVHDLVCPKHGTQWQPDSFGSESEAKARGRSAVVR